MQTSFMLSANGAANPESVKRRRKIAEAMLESGMNTTPIASPWQGVARIAQSLVGGWSMGRADQAESEGRQSVKDAMAKALNGGDKSALIEAASNPWMDNNSLGMITNQWNRQQEMADPAYQLRLKTGQLQYDQMSDPSSVPLTALQQAQLTRLQQPDYQSVGKDSVLFNAQDKSFVTPPPGTPGQAIDDPLKISKNFEGSPGMSRIAQIAPTIQSMQKSLTDPSAMADLDFVYGLAKILDPTSVVRESEAGMVIESQGIGPQLLGQLNKLMSGEQAMLPAIRNKLYGVAYRRAKELADQAEQERGHFSGVATANQFDPNLYLQQVPQLPDWQDPNTPKSELPGYDNGGNDGWTVLPNGVKIRRKGQ